MRERIRQLDEQATAVEAELDRLVLALPNLPDPSVPDGEDESDNVVVRDGRRAGDVRLRRRSRTGSSASELGIIDFERGVKLSGSRFYLLRGRRRAAAARADRLDARRPHPRAGLHRDLPAGDGQGADAWSAPASCRSSRDNLYHDAEEDFWFIPTAEVPVTNMYRDEILPASAPADPLRAYTPCFRREKMSAGRDMRGIKRGHQFDKVEMVKFVEPGHV